MANVSMAQQQHGRIMECGGKGAADDTALDCPERQNIPGRWSIQSGVDAYALPPQSISAKNLTQFTVFAVVDPFNLVLTASKAAAKRVSIRNGASLEISNMNKAIVAGSAWRCSEPCGGSLVEATASCPGKGFGAWSIVLGVLLLALGGAARGQEAPPNGLAPKAPIRQITEDQFELGKVRFDKKARTVTFPAAVNMKEGLIEYLVVHARGKAHESLLITETEPYHIHLAVLLLSGKPVPEGVDGAKTDAPPAVRNVKVTLRPTGGKSAAGEDWVFDLHAKAPMVQGNWRYAGSRVVEGVFLAQRDGSIVSVIDDGDALINNSRPRSDNDENWQIHSVQVPAIGTEVQVVIQLVSAKAETK